MGGKNSLADSRKVPGKAHRGKHRNQSRRARTRSLYHHLRYPGSPTLHRCGSTGRLERGQISGLSRAAAIYPRHSRQRIPRQALHHAAILRLRLAGRNQPALQVPARKRREWTVGGFRSPHAHGLRLRSPRERRRGWQMRRRHRLTRRHGNSLRRHRSGKNHGLNDHQLACISALGDVPGGGRKAGRGLEEDFRNTAERHPEGIHRAKGIHLSPGAFDAPGGRHVRVRLQIHAEVQYHFHQWIPHPRGGFNRAAGAGFHSV